MRMEDAAARCRGFGDFDFGRYGLVAAPHTAAAQPLQLAAAPHHSDGEGEGAIPGTAGAHRLAR